MSGNQYNYGSGGTGKKDGDWLSWKEMRARGREAVTAAFRNGGEMIAYDLTEEHYDTLDMGGGTYLCQGIGWITSKPGQQMYVRYHQRCTFACSGSPVETRSWTACSTMLKAEMS